MPLLENSATDDQILLDGDVGFSGGQASNVRRNIIKQGAYTAGQNIDFDVFGNLVTRRGASQGLTSAAGDRWEEATDVWETVTARVWGSDDLDGAIISAAVLDNTSTEMVILAEYDGASVKNIRYLQNGTAFSAAITTFSGTDVFFAQLSDRMYWCDGSEALQYVDTAGTGSSITAGKVTSITMTEGGSGYDAVPTVTISGGGVAAGTAVLGYNLGVARVDITNEGTGYSSSAPPTVTFSAPTSGTTATGVAHVSQLPSEPKLLTSHTNRLFCCSADTSVPQDVIYVSGILDGQSWDVAGDQIRVTRGDGDPIVALCPWYDFKLVVLKERSVWVVDANPAQDVSDWTISLISDRVGCVGHKSVQQVGSDVYFLSREGIQSVSNIEAGAQAAVNVAISAPIDDFINRINQAQWGKCASIFYGNRFMLSVPLDGSAYPNYTLVYNTIHKSWSGFWVGWKPRCFIVSAFGGEMRLSFGDEEGKFYTWRDFVNEQDATVSDYMDDTSVYLSEVISRGYNYGEMYSDKLGYQVEFDLENFYYNQDQDVKFYFLKNMGDDDLLLLTEGDGEILDEGGDPITGWATRQLLGEVTVENRESHFVKGYNLLSKNKFKEIQFTAVTTSGRLALQAIKTSAFTDTINPQR